MLNLRIRTLSKLLQRNIQRRHVFTKDHSSTSQPAVQITQDEYDKQLKDFQTLKNITKRTRSKKPQKPPFVKNLLLGKFDTDILTYPQLEKDEVEHLENDAQNVQKLLRQNHMVNCTSLGDKRFRQNLADYRMIGLQVSQFMDGRECNITESMRFLEVLSEHNLRDNIIMNEQLGVSTLIKFTNDGLKQKYLGRIISGELLTATCLSEDGAADHSGFNTKAQPSSDGGTWILNGKKVWVVNGLCADILVVFAVTKVIKKDVARDIKLTAFVVERDFPGITISKSDSGRIETATIKFENTPVPKENIIGEADKGVDVLNAIITEYRLSVGPACITLVKKILNSLTTDIVQKSNQTNLLHKMDAVRSKMAEIATSIYAMESVTYLTAGLLDNYENQDCQVESSIVKIFCSERALEASIKSLDLTGVLASSESHFANEYHREVLPYLTLYDANDSLKIIVALLSLQHAGITLNDTITKIRNPLFFSGFILRKMFTDRRNVADNPKLDMNLVDYIHPSCLQSAQNLEYCVKRIEFAAEILLARYGPEVVNYHMELRRLAECIIDTYILVACIGRASRSYCIGLQNADCEMVMMNTISNTVKEKVQYLVNKIHWGPYQTNDDNYKIIAKRVFKSKQYPMQHALARNF